MNSVKKWIFTTFLGFFLMLAFWLSIVYVSACGLSISCHRATTLAVVDRTSVPTLVPATQPAFIQPTAVPSAVPNTSSSSDSTPEATTGEDIARPSNPGGPGEAINLTGDAASGKDLFVANCASCHGDEGKGGRPNPGTEDGTVPELNPIDPTLISADYKTFAINVDLFIEHGSVPEGTIPNLIMPSWGDRGALTPQQIADLIAYIISLNK